MADEKLMMKVPFLDLKAQYKGLYEEVNDAIQRVLADCAFAGGPFVEQFEKNFSQYCRVKETVAVGSGTEALWIALTASGITSGDEVILPVNTFIATAEAVSYCGARVVFVDVDSETYNIDVDKLEKVITPSTKAVIPVHLYGQMADMDPIVEICRSRGLILIEDACQAHGAEYKTKKAGSIGDTGCFSFYPGKNLGAYGEAGAVVTNNSELSAKMRMLRDHGQNRKYYHQLIGWNSRMDGIQGAVLNVKLRYLDQWTKLRRENAKKYNELLYDIADIKLPSEAEYARHVYHIYSIRVKQRDALKSYLQEYGISCGIHYPISLHLQEAYQELGYKEGDFPIAEEASAEQLSLPMYAELTEEQIGYVSDRLRGFYGR